MKRAILVAFLLSSCAQTYTPVVDLKGVDKIPYEADLAECRQYGEEVKPTNDPVVTAILLIAAFAALGAIVGAVDDDSSVAEDAGLFAALGGASAPRVSPVPKRRTLTSRPKSSATVSKAEGTKCWTKRSGLNHSSTTCARCRCTSKLH